MTISIPPSRSFTLLETQALLERRLPAQRAMARAAVEAVAGMALPNHLRATMANLLRARASPANPMGEAL